MCAAVLTLAGCGGPIRADELQRGVETLSSNAAEGAILARGAAENRTRATFTRVQAGELAQRSAHEGEKLADAQAHGDVADVRAKAVTLAGNVADALGALQVQPGDEALAQRLERRLDRLSSQASRLAGQL